MEVTDEVVRNAQATVDAIDREVARLLNARETLVKTFGLGVREQPRESPQALPEDPNTTESAPTPTEPQIDLPGTFTEHSGNGTDVYAVLRRRVLHSLRDGPERVWQVRVGAGIGTRNSKAVLDHPWFRREGNRIGLSELGEQELRKEVVGE